MTVASERRAGALVHHFTRDARLCPEKKARADTSEPPVECPAMKKAVKEAYRVRGM
jgi:hypothetical protein